MDIEILHQGFVAKQEAEQYTEVAVGPRAAVTRQGDVVCTYMAQSALGVNDFVPMLARSDDQGITWQEQGPLWPRLTGRQSLFGSISRSPSGILAAYGMSTPIDRPDEPFWSEANHGLETEQPVLGRLARRRKDLVGSQADPTPPARIGRSSRTAVPHASGPLDRLLRAV